MALPGPRTESRGIPGVFLDSEPSRAKAQLQMLKAEGTRVTGELLGIRVMLGSDLTCMKSGLKVT